MASLKFMPRKLQTAFSRLAMPEAAKAILTLVDNPEYCVWTDDFIGDALDARYASSVGSGTEVVGITAASNGILTVATQGNSAGDSAGVGLGLHWKGDLGVYFVAYVKVSSGTSSKFEIGLTDSAADDGAIDVKATPTFTATDCALFVYDVTDDTNVTFITAQAGAVGANVDSTFTLVNDTFFWVEIVVQDGQASGYINGQYVGGGAITSTAPLTPWFYAGAVGAATAVTTTCDWFGIIGPRV